MSNETADERPETENPYLVGVNVDGHIELTMNGHCLLNIENATALVHRLQDAIDQAVDIADAKAADAPADAPTAPDAPESPAAPDAPAAPSE